MPPTDGLQVAGRRSRRTRLALGALAVAGAVLAAWFWLLHPAPLPTTDAPVSAQTPVGTPVYVRLAATDPGRTVRISGVTEDARTTIEGAEVEVLLCDGGTFDVTTQPDLFCRRLVDPAGERLGPDDALVARVAAPQPGALYLQRLRVAYTDGPQRRTADAGRPAAVTILQR